MTTNVLCILYIEYFVDEEWSKLHDEFINSKIFNQKYKQCKTKCNDIFFDCFYKQFSIE